MMTRSGSARLSAGGQQPPQTGSSPFRDALTNVGAPSPRSVRWGDAAATQGPSTPAPLAASALAPRQPTTPFQQHLQQRQPHQHQQQQQQRTVSTPQTPHTPQRGAVQHSTTPQPTSTATTPAKVASTLAPSSGSVVASSSVSLSRRLRWNGTALAILWLLPAVSSKPTDAYWALLDSVYHTFGGSVDEKLDAVLGWISWATSIVLLFNLIEAAVLQKRSASPALILAQKPAQGQQLQPGTPSAGPATPRNFGIGLVQFNQAKGSPKTRPSSIGAASPLSAGRMRAPSASTSPHKTMAPGTPTQDYSRFSPAASAFAGGTSGVAGSFGASTPSPFNRSSPTAAMRSSPGIGQSSPMGLRASPSPATALGPSSSPLAAYRARNASGRTSLARSASSAFAADEDDGVDDDDDAREAMGDDSFEVERALRSLSQGLVGSGP
ncbi:uncharacterized protein PFL1_05741 [Pseudozyma flocculosa PF-1]|uniref:Uncharacterized protein n=2 Tax=Pseudozyma flocculosa TaxID=84751 RepID=A0A5C3F916_9BASI|nr:uncharacterized protein PFL1_05741 [Pseudozyma flocculosa PF-1]EPQ26762.1 hypothetical protein PFL1_05741 [Pseudozyma flocculosa PF-1]SPO40912.1 uncharacterized protein PSFLO_06394 [Pseudozyma flocculosa]